MIRKLPGVSILGALGLWYLIQTHLVSNIWRLTDDYTLALRLFQLSAFINVAVLCGIVFIAINSRDILARILWAVAAILETYTLVEYSACKILGDTYEKADLEAIWGATVAKGSCARIIGPLGDWIEPIVGITATGWILWHLMTAARRNNP